MSWRSIVTAARPTPVLYLERPPADQRERARLRCLCDAFGPVPLVHAPPAVVKGLLAEGVHVRPLRRRDIPQAGIWMLGLADYLATPALCPSAGLRAARIGVPEAYSGWG